MRLVLVRRASRLPLALLTPRRCARLASDLLAALAVVLAVVSPVVPPVVWPLVWPAACALGAFCAEEPADAADPVCAPGVVASFEV